VAARAATTASFIFRQAPQVVTQLLPQPVFGIRAENPRNLDRHWNTQTGLAAQQRRQSRSADAQTPRRLSHAQAERTQTQVVEDGAGMRRIVVLELHTLALCGEWFKSSLIPQLRTLQRARLVPAPETALAIHYSRGSGTAPEFPARFLPHIPASSSWPRRPGASRDPWIPAEHALLSGINLCDAWISAVGKGAMGESPASPLPQRMERAEL
jgi:hypothetical protein